MKWLEEANLSSDGRNLTGKYTMSDTEVTIPGNQEVIFVLKVKNAVNGTKIQPTFTFMLEENEENEKKEVKALKEITVSAAGRYNIQLHRSTTLENKATVDYGEGEKSGRMYGYGFAVQLYNNEYSEEENPYAKGLKGLEYPKGEISFDIDLKLEREKSNSDISEDITNENTPILWNYRENNSSTSDLSGKIADRNMYYLSSSGTISDNQLPQGIDNGDRDCSTYNSGDIKIEQDGSILHVTINNYEFDETFPQFLQSYTDNPQRNKIYNDNVGTFSIGYMQIFVPDPTESAQDNNNYYLTLEINKFRATTSNGEITKQEVSSDDISRVQYIIGDVGSMSILIDFPSFTNRGRRGDSAVFKNQVIDVSIISSISTSLNPELYIYSEDYIYKFDGECLEPAYNEITFVIAQGGLKFKAFFLTKKNGTNWTNQEEMNKTIELEDFNIYKNKQDIPSNYTIVGILFESLEGGVHKPVYNEIRVKMNIKETANIGQTYGMTMAVRGWVQENQLDREIYTVEKLNSYDDYPEPYWIKAGQEYVKTEYDENGQIIAGTHKNGYFAGNTVLVVGANLTGRIGLVQKNEDNKDKINYDLGKNENIVTYSVEPQLDANEYLASQIEDVTLKAQVTLPKGLSYELGSSKRGEEEYTEPEITENSDGSTSLVWYIYGVTSVQAITPIIFDAKIDNGSINETQYETTFIISEQKGEDGISKIGNSEISKRTSTVTINIINLASFRVYKEVENQVIDKNGEIHYTITGKNTSETGLPEFVLLDIMPYNEDGRGTKYNGKYTISKIKITKNKDEKEIENDFKLYITKSATKSGQGDQYEQIKKLNVKDPTIGNITTNTGNTTNTNSIQWEELQETNGEYIINREQANDGITAIAVKGELETQTEIVVDIYIKTEENKAEDKYVNSATAQTESLSEVVQTSQEYAQVLERIISGKVWLDENYNNIIDNNESLERLINNVNSGATGNIVDSGDTSQNEENTENTNTTETTENNENILIEEITLKLYKVKEDKSLEEAKDIDGAIIPEIHPNAKGYYEFRGLAQGNYVVKIEYNGEKYKLSEKEIQDNKEITSKFIEEEKGKGKTEEITKLNSSANLKIEENNINAGLIEIINLEFTKVAEEDHENKIGGTEFQLYKLKCTTHEERYHDEEQIDIENINTNCWELVDTQSSKSGILNDEETGKVKFENLELNTEYRLVETKASFNRLKPNGQWKIEFLLIDGTETQENVNRIKGEIQENKTESENLSVEQNKEITKINNEVEIKIQSMGNIEPPAFVITKNEETGVIKELLLPNRAYYQFPASGSIGSRTIIQIGCSVFSIGTILLINILINRKLKIRNKNK